MTKADLYKEQKWDEQVTRAVRYWRKNPQADSTEVRALLRVGCEIVRDAAAVLGRPKHHRVLASMTQRNRLAAVIQKLRESRPKKCPHPQMFSILRKEQNFLRNPKRRVSKQHFAEVKSWVVETISVNAGQLAPLAEELREDLVVAEFGPLGTKPLLAEPSAGPTIVLDPGPKKPPPKPKAATYVLVPETFLDEPLAVATKAYFRRKLLENPDDPEIVSIWSALVNPQRRR